MKSTTWTEDFDWTAGAYSNPVPDGPFREELEQLLAELAEECSVSRVIDMVEALDDVAPGTVRAHFGLSENESPALELLIARLVVGDLATPVEDFVLLSLTTN